MNSRLLLDIETNGLPPGKGGRILCAGYKFLGRPEIPYLSKVWLPGDVIGMDSMSFREALADPTVPIVSMTKYDVRYLKLMGYEVNGPYHDLQVMAWVLNENQPLDLDSLALRYNMTKMDKRIKREANVPNFRTDEGKRVSLTELGPEHEAWPQLLAYCLRDVEAEVELYNTLMRRLEDTDWLDYFLEEMVPFTEALVNMEIGGLPVNLDDSEELRGELEEQAEDMEASLRAEAGLPESFNLNSSDHLASYLYYPVFELRDALPITKDQRDRLKQGILGPQELVVGFTAGKAGRAYAHGSWTLKGRGIMPTEKTPSGDKWSTSSPVLRSNYAAMLDPWCQSLLAYRKVQKMLTTYLRPMAERVVWCGSSQGSDAQGQAEVNGAQDLGGDVLVDVNARTSEREQEGAGVLAPLAGGSEARAISSPGGTSSSFRRESLEQRPLELSGPAQATSRGDSLLQPHLSQLGGWRLFGTYSQTGTKTGRLSSAGPNMQNMPSHGPLGESMRGLFQGNLVVGDYAQIEPRLQAHYSQDPKMLDVYRNGRDIYLETARGIFGPGIEADSPERGLCKTLILAMGYGAYEKKLAQILTINGHPTDVLTAKGYLNELQQLYKGFFGWREAVIQAVKARGYVQTIGGQHRRLKASFEDRRNWKNIGYGERQAVNAIIQGSAADIIRRVMSRCDWSVYGLKLLAQVHDELVWEGETAASGFLGNLRNDCERGHGFELSVPLRFEIHGGQSWFTAKEGTPEGLDLDEEEDE